MLPSTLKARCAIATKPSWYYLSLLAFCLSHDGAVSAKQFQLGCNAAPFPVSTAARPIDRVCPNEGDSAPDSPKGRQNAVKNNLCGTGNPVTLTFADFMSLQEQAAAMGVPFGATGSGPTRVEHLPTDRSQLTSGNFRVRGDRIREGDVVQIVAFMDDPHPADLGSGEDVNCHQSEAAENDIHINLVQSPAPPKPRSNDPDADEKRAARKHALCKAIVAEVIPHFRPDVYEAQFFVPIAKRRIPVKVTGQLFFDAAHRPCDGDTPRDSSVRGTLWEIHPIYSLLVCKHRTLAQCPADSAEVWQQIDEWIQANGVTAAEIAESAVFEEDEDRKGEHEGE